MIKIILFDIDNTLLSFDKFVKETMKKGFKEFGLCDYKDEMYNVFNQINTNLWHKIENGEIDLEELKKKRWNMIFEQLGIDGNGEDFEKYFRNNLFESAIPVDGSLDLLKHLYSKYVLCVASNGPYLQQINRLKMAGMFDYFSDVFISEEIGASKPSEKFFNTCLNRLSLKFNRKISTNEVMIIGDSLSSDIVGGINSGMKTCFYNPNQKTIPNEINIDYQVSSLFDIKNIL
jgi:YjjG family noncanonical pyrimidine nucleotidase